MDISTYLIKAGVKQSDFARAIEVPPSMLYQWLRGLRPVAVKHCMKIEKQTGGEVTRRDLRPHDWQNIWPELATPAKRRRHISAAPVAT
jgi:DNA-binding transcriptional regulator YdaS (Cro superfamily)